MGPVTRRRSNSRGDDEEQLSRIILFIPTLREETQRRRTSINRSSAGKRASIAGEPAEEGVGG